MNTIELSANLFLPGYLTPIGGNFKNLPVFTGQFQLKVTPKIIVALANEDGNISVRGANVYVDQAVLLGRRHGKGVLVSTTGYLKDVSVRYFRFLQKQGWVLDEAFAKQFGLPSDKKNQSLQNHNREQEEKIATMRDLEKRTDKAWKNMVSGKSSKIPVEVISLDTATGQKRVKAALAAMKKDKRRGVLKIG